MLLLSTMQSRCAWVKSSNPLSVTYHDTEWGVPIHDDQKLFEFIVLESAQAGLSWQTILNRREGYRSAFHRFDPKKVAAMTTKEVEQLMQDQAIIRNRRKIEATIKNARAFLAVQNEWGSFTAYAWKWVDGVPIQNAWKHRDEVPASTPLAHTMSADLKKRGFAFLGPTIWYAHMEAVGMVNDHTIDCFRYAEIKRLSREET